MVQWRPMLRAPVLGWGLGLVAGGFEALKLAFTLQLSVGFGEALAGALVAVLCGGLVGAVGAIGPGLVVSLPPFRGFKPRQNALAMAFTGAVLGLWYLLPAAALKLDQGIVAAALAIAAMPIGVGGVVWYNAKYWLIREDMGDVRRLGWWFFAPIFGLVLATAAAGWLASADQGNARALATDPAVLLITVDGLGVEDVGGFGAASGATPALEALASVGIAYEMAVTPSPEIGPAAAAMLTGRHPLRADILRSGDRLALGYDTLPEQLRGKEGYATAAFVSSAALGRGLGFEQGFAVYDDGRAPGPPGVQEILLVSHVEQLMVLLGQVPAWSPGRDDAATLDRAGRWIEGLGSRSLLAWVQLSELRRTPDAGRAAVVKDLDAGIGALVDTAREAVGDRPLIVLVMGSGGPEATGISDRAVRVPLITVPHGLHNPTRRIPQQVRLMDVAPTVLDLLKLDPLKHAEGAELTGFAERVKDRDYGCLLMGWEGDNLLLGYRAKDAGGEGHVKLVVAPASGARQLYSLAQDPDEQVSVAESQPTAADVLEGRIKDEAGRLWREVPPPSGPRWLQALLRRPAPREGG